MATFAIMNMFIFVDVVCIAHHHRRQIIQSQTELVRVKKENVQLKVILDTLSTVCVVQHIKPPVLPKIPPKDNTGNKLDSYRDTSFEGKSELASKEILIWSCTAR